MEKSFCNKNNVKKKILIKNSDYFCTNSSYFTEINSTDYDPIDNNEIKKLVKIAQKGYDSETKTWIEEAEEAKLKIIKANMRLIPFIIHKIIGGNNPLFMDCINQSHFAIVKCILKYDADSETHFATYAQVAVRRYIWRYLRENSSVVKLPSGQISKRNKEEEEIYKSPGVLDKLFKRNYAPVNYMCSLDYGFDDGIKVHKSLFSSIPHSDNSSSFFCNKMKQFALDSFKCLSNNERLIIEKRFFSNEKETLKGIAVNIGLTGERVRQIEKNALGKMRRFINDQQKGGEM